MEIMEGMDIIDLAIKIDKSLIISDTHIGYEEALNKQGILMPRFHSKELMGRVKRILERSGELDRIIINGDVKHEFGIISETEWRHTLRFLDLLSGYCKEIILIKGNHDKILGPIAKKRDIGIVDFFMIDDNLIVHGDRNLDRLKIDEDKLKKVKAIVIGHEHPAISLREESRIETFKCFLRGGYKRYDLIVQPSLNLVAEGTDILREKTLSPFLKQDLGDFEVYVVADKVYKFGKIKNIT